MTKENGFPFIHESFFECTDGDFYIDDEDPGMFILEKAKLKIPMGQKKVGDIIDLVIIDMSNSILEMYDTVINSKGETDTEEEPFATFNIKLSLAN